VRFGRALAILTGAVLATGCGGEEIKWTEEVRLHDGKVIQVKRRTELTGGGFPVQKRGFPKYHELCYAPLGVHWKSRPEYLPEVFEIVDGKAYAKVSLGNDCARCMEHGFPETDALYFTWTGQGWKPIGYPQFPPGLRFNLLASPVERDPANDARGLVSVADKEKRDASVYYSLRTTGAKGLNELPSRKGTCSKCKASGAEALPPAEIFMPSQTGNCD
jgi:hypothetical protein